MTFDTKRPLATFDTKRPHDIFTSLCVSQTTCTNIQIRYGLSNFKKLNNTVIIQIKHSLINFSCIAIKFHTPVSIFSAAGLTRDVHASDSSAHQSGSHGDTKCVYLVHWSLRCHYLQAPPPDSPLQSNAASPKYEQVT